MPTGSPDASSQVLALQKAGANTILTVNNYFGVLQAVLANLGIGVLPDYMTQDFPDLQRVLPDVESSEIPVFLAYPEELRQSQRISAFRDFVTEEIIEHRRKLKEAAPA